MSLSLEISEDFDDKIRNRIPHDIGFSKDPEINNKNIFIASLHLLTNINSLYKYLLSLIDKNENVFIQLCNYIQDEGIKINVNENKNEKSLEKIMKELKDHVFESPKYDKKIDEPKKFIIDLLKDLKESEILPDSIVYNFQYKCDNCKIIFSDELKFIEFNIPEIINYYQNKTDTITIYDCLYFFFNSLKKDNSSFINSSLFCEKCRGRKLEVFLRQLPENLIIFINYGKKPKNYDLSFEFDEEISFKGFDFLNEEDKKKEFFLSSLMACKNMGSHLEIYYTYARRDEKSMYKIYNGRDVRDNMKVTNKLKKEKMHFNSYKESWPVVLVFTDKKQEEEQ
jgi:hypothetical protein